MTPLAELLKDPAAILDYAVDWSGALPAGDTIASAAATADAGITVQSHSYSGQTHTIWLSGGTAGSSYLVTSEVTTAAGRKDQRTLRITVEDR
jgi:hypothetical protein